MPQDELKHSHVEKIVHPLARVDRKHCSDTRRRRSCNNMAIHTPLIRPPAGLAVSDRPP